MGKKVRRGGNLGSRLKTLRRSPEADTLARPAEHAPIRVDGSGEPELTLSFGRWSGKRQRAAQVERGGQIESELEVGAGDESGRATLDGIARSSGFRQGDGFDGQESARLAYETYMRSNIQADAARFETLRQQGTIDTFDPLASPLDVEQRGHFVATSHVVRLFEHWLLETPDRDEVIDKAASWLAGFSHVDMVRKVLTELESKPIRDVYPLEVLLQLLEAYPEKLPGIAWGAVFAAQLALRPGERVYAGHPIQLPAPANLRIKSFALLGGDRPGYEFFPSPRGGRYTLLVDTPGEWSFALLAVRTSKVGKMERELPGGIVESFRLRVSEMGRKEAPPAR